MTPLNPPNRPNNIDDLIQRMQDPERDEAEQKALKALVTCMIGMFRDHKLPSYYAEVSRLSDVADDKQYKDLMVVLFNALIEHSSEGSVLDRDLLPSYNYCLRRHRDRYSDHFLVAPLGAFKQRLEKAIELNDINALYYFTFVLGAMLDVAVDIKVAGIGHDAIYQPLCDQLSGLKDHDEPRLAQAAIYAYQALKGVPDDLGPWDIFWRTSGAAISATAKIAGAVSSMDPSKIPEAAPDLFELVGLFGKLLESIQDLQDGATKLKGAFIEDIGRFKGQRVWFDVLHYTGPLLLAGKESPGSLDKAAAVLANIIDDIPCGDDWQFWCGLYSQLEQAWLNGNDDVQNHVCKLIERTFCNESLRKLRANDARVQGWINLISTTINRKWKEPTSKPRRRFPLCCLRKERPPPKLQKPFRQTQSDEVSKQLFEDAWKKCKKAHKFYADARLVQYYLEGKRLAIQRLSGNYLDMGSCYINLGVIEKSPEQEKGPKGIEVSLRERLNIPVLEEGEYVQLHDLLKSRKLRDGRDNKPTRILIRGRAGIGKTTICKKIVHEFLHGRLPWDFDRILWVPLRRLRDRSSLEDFIEQEFFLAHPDQRTLSEALKGVLFDQPESRTLFLLDGFDEVAAEVSTGKSLSDLFAIFRDQENVIITSRPHAVRPFEFDNFDLELETVGFRPDQAQQYLDQAGKQKEITVDEVDEIKDFIEGHWLMESLLRIPIQLDALCYTWGEGLLSQHAKTMTALYQAIEVKLWRKDMVQLNKLDELSSRQCFERMQIKRYMGEETDLVEKLAFNGLYNNIVDFSTGHLNKLYANLPGKAGASNIMLMGLSFFRTTDAKPPNKTFYFLH